MIYILIGGLLLLTGGLWWIAVYWAAPPESLTPVTYELSPGTTIMQVADDLESLGVVRSNLTLQVLFAYQFDAREIKAGTYQFTQTQSASEIAVQLVTGQFANDLTSITFIEGTTVQAYSEVAQDIITDFDQAAWDTLTTDQEGQLFPDTYFIPADYTTAQLVELLQEQHNTVIAELRTQYPDSTLTDDEVRILASILEREANDEQSMRTVAGILLNRLAIDMPLQADATIEYVLDTPLNELPPGQLASELREIDSPYNTYKIIGLPPTPIGNPGRTALMAALNPIESDFFYYITGTDGQFYYTPTYNQHLINIERHLR